MSAARTKRSVREVRIVNAAMDTVCLRGREIKVVRGRLRPMYLPVVDRPAYQRLLMTTQKHDELIDALEPGGMGIPDDLLLCTRGNDSRLVGIGEVALLTDAIYTLDGLQRYGAAMARVERGQTVPDFGVKILLGTDEPLEVDLFYQVNRLQTKVATHVHLRNAGTNAALQALRDMAEETEGFPTIQWDQQRKSGDQITAHMLYEIAIVLHGYAQGRDIEGIIAALDELTGTNGIGTDRLTDNTREFFQLLKRCTSGGTSMEPYARRVGVLRGLALFFAKYEDFWNGNKLVVRADKVQKVRSLQLDDVTTALQHSNPAGAFCRRLELHVESGRRTQMLKLRQY